MKEGQRCQFTDEFTGFLDTALVGFRGGRGPQSHPLQVWIEGGTVSEHRGVLLPNPGRRPRIGYSFGRAPPSRPAPVLELQVEDQVQRGLGP